MSELSELIDEFPETRLKGVNPDGRQEGEPPAPGRYRDMAFNEHHRTRAKFVRWEFRKGKRVAIRLCKETGGEFVDKNGQTDFASSKARQDFAQRRMKRGLAVLDTAMRWRGDRSDKEALADLCNIIGHFLSEDKAAGRPSW